MCLCLPIHPQLTPLNPIPGRGGEGEEEIDAATQQLAVIPKKEEFVLEKEIIDVSYICNIKQAIALKPVKLQQVSLTTMDMRCQSQLQISSTDAQC